METKEKHKRNRDSIITEKRDYSPYNLEENIVGEISDPKKAATYLGLLNKKNEKDNKLYWQCYDELSENGKFIINQMLLEFLPEAKKDSLFGEHYKFLLANIYDYNSKPINTYHIAKNISVKRQCFSKRKLQQGFEQNIHELTKLLNRFEKQSKTHEDNPLTEEIATLFSIDLDVLTKGYGKEYEIDLENIKKIASEKNMNMDEVYEQLGSKFLECTLCNYKQNCTYSNDYIEYQIFDKKGQGKALAEILGVSENEIFIEHLIELRTNQPIFEIYYNKLNNQGKQYIHKLIETIYWTENSTIYRE